MNFSKLIKFTLIAVGALSLTQCSDFFDTSSLVQPQAVDAQPADIPEGPQLAQR